MPELVFHPVADSETLAEDQGLPFDVDGVRVAVFRHNERLYALEDRCPHADATIAMGMVENGCVACPWHFAEFRLATGEVMSGPATCGIATHAVRERDGKIEVALRVAADEDG